MPKKFSKLLEWAGHFEAIQAILHTEFVRTVIWPVGVTLMTSGAGILGGLPLMWVFMASTVAFAGTMTGLLRSSEYFERRNPRNKLHYLGTYVATDLTPTQISVANRQFRRAQKTKGKNIESHHVLGSDTIISGVKRTIDKVQVMVEFQNTATFPISVVFESSSNGNRRTKTAT